MVSEEQPIAVVVGVSINFFPDLLSRVDPYSHTSPSIRKREERRSFWFDRSWRSRRNSYSRLRKAKKVAMVDLQLDLCTAVSSPKMDSPNRSKEWIVVGMFSGEFLV